MSPWRLCGHDGTGGRALTLDAVTAQPFCTSARGVFDMLGRHGLAVLVVDRFTSLVMHMGSLFLALVVAGGTTLVVKAYTDGQSGLPQEQADLMLAVFGITAWVLSSVVLNFFGALVLNIVDAAYICFALDLDTQAAHRHEMRQVLILVAKPTTVVQQPGGGFGNFVDFTAHIGDVGHRFIFRFMGRRHRSARRRGHRYRFDNRFWSAPPADRRHRIRYGGSQAPARRAIPSEVLPVRQSDCRR